MAPSPGFTPTSVNLLGWTHILAMAVAHRTFPRLAHALLRRRTGNTRRARGIQGRTPIRCASVDTHATELHLARTRKTFTPRLRVCDLRAEPTPWIGETVKLQGWVRTIRKQKTFAFLEVNDGSAVTGLQAVVDETCEGVQLVRGGGVATGAAVTVEGTVVESPGGGQAVELRATKLTLVGGADPNTYPLQKKRHSFEFLRGIAHLRPRTNTIGAVSRVRSALAFATHAFFRENGFQYVHSPIITASDCEGAGEQFLVTTKVAPGEKLPEEAIKSGEIDFAGDFFEKPAYLTVSGQLNAEMFACALSNVYTFGPTFRAENSNTSRHLAEFWMIEPELAFADLDDVIACAEAYLKFCISYVLKNCSEDIEFFNKFIEKGLLDRLIALTEKDFEVISYTRAVQILEESGNKFEYPVAWGVDLQSEHERFLTEKVFDGCPVFVTDYPKGIKAFYMRLNDDGQTVAAMDMLVPGVGEMIGGSQREERLEVLQERITSSGLDLEPYQGYLDLRRYGSVPHAGFGLGFERLVQYVTGMENIRDVIPFPRYPGHADF